MENAADIPRKSQGHEGGVERSGRDITRHHGKREKDMKGEIKGKASTTQTVQGHEGAVPAHRGNSGGT